MKKFIKTIKSNKVLSVLSVLIIGVLFILVARVTYAFLAPVINEAQTDVVGTTDTVDDFKFELGDALKLDASPTTLKENGSNYSSSTTAKALLKANSTKKTATYNYYVYFQIKSNTFKYSDGSTPEIILTVTNPNGDEVTSIDGLTYGTFNGISGFDVTTKKGLFNIANNYEITSNSSTTYTTQEWNITLTYLNLPIDQSSNFGNSMEVKVHITKNEKKLTVADVCSNGQTLSSCIVAMYGKDDTLYHHTSTLTNGAGDNSYRYAGPSDSVNNFVCFGSTTTPCPTDNLYRIIGVIDGKVKLIKYDYMTIEELGTDGEYVASVKELGFSANYYKGSKEIKEIGVYYWNNDSKKNTWSESNLNKTNLNTNFLNYIGTVWASKIATTTWKVGGNTDENITALAPATVYQNEIVSSNIGEYSTTGEKEYNAKIGLMYVSDYEFAASSNAWTLVGYNSDSTKDYRVATNNNWMYMGLDEWTITRFADRPNYAFGVTSAGNVRKGIINAFAHSAGRASFNLESSITYVSGSGSMSDPIVIN